jgi:hypothetical protein
MSGIDYSSYVNNDYSIFSNSEIILPFDSQDLSGELFNNLLNYTRSGGTLVVVNPNEKFEGKFAKLLTLGSTANKTQEFVRIASHDKDGFNINVSGTVKDLSLPQTSKYFHGIEIVTILILSLLQLRRYMIKDESYTSTVLDILMRYPTIRKRIFCHS